jgi:ankyrin repeat protein
MAKGLADVDRLGRSALHYAVADRKPLEVAALLAAGFDLNAADKNGWSPLHFAAQNQDATLIQALIQGGAAIDPVDSFGNSPLSNAVFNYRGDGEAITCLLMAGANPDLANKHDVSPRSLAGTIANYDGRLS